MAWKFLGVTGMAVMIMAAPALPSAAAPQAAQPITLEAFAGAWEGTAQSPSGEVTLRSMFKVADGKLTGAIESSMGPIPVASAAIQGDKLMVTIDFQGTPGTLACGLKGNRIEGVWEVGGNNGTFWLARAGAAASSSGVDSVVGAWAGEVQLAGQAVGFNLTLRKNGDSLAGEIGSAEGSTPLAKATWTDGTLQLEFTYVGGQPVAMSAKLEGGKLAGAIDFNKGEAAGTWTAARK
jgi:hypothetical protein